MYHTISTTRLLVWAAERLGHAKHRAQDALDDGQYDKAIQAQMEVDIYEDLMDAYVSGAFDHEPCQCRTVVQVGPQKITEGV